MGNHHSSQGSMNGVTPGQLNDFNYLSQYAHASYCASNVAGSESIGQRVACVSDLCPNVQDNGATILQVLTGGWSDTKGFISVDNTAQLIVVSFRGSNSDHWHNVFTELDVAKTSCEDLAPDCMVHEGFFAVWSAMKDDVMQTVQAATTQYPGYKIVTTGHSLGAAVATLAAAYLRQAGIPCDIYTYGSPRVGNQEFVDALEGQGGHHFRVTHVNDPVPRVPQVMMGYVHTQYEYWLSTGDPTTIEYGPDDVKVCVGSTTDECDGGSVLDGTDPLAHKYYLRLIEPCHAA